MPQQKDFSSDRPSERQAQILRVATELFARHGYRGVGMRMIAEAVGIRTSSLYYHFSSKQELLYSIGLDVTRDFIDQNLPLLEGDGSAAERAAALLRAHVIYFADHQLQQLVSRRELRELSFDHLQEVIHHERLYQQRVQELIEEGQRSGEFQVPDAHIAGLALIDMINGLNVWFRRSGATDIEDLAEQYVVLALQLLGARDRN